jgi:hypothetical protein
MPRHQKWLLRFYKDLLDRFEKLERKVCIIIQGPLNERSIETIPSYKKYGEVVVSCWENDDLRLLEKHKKDITLVINKYSEVPHSRLRSFGRHGPNPWIYQCYSTLKGLEATKAHFSIKLRSDESYPNLEEMIKRLMFWYHKENLIHKVITSDIYFRFDAQEKFHPSDHIIAGRTRMLREGFSNAVLNAKAERKKVYKFPEVLICTSIIESIWNSEEKRYEIADPNKSKELMQKYFDILPIKDLIGAKWSSSYRKYEALTQPEHGWCQSIDDI